MTVAHVMGVPIEESVMQLLPAATALAAALVVAARATLVRLRRWARRVP